MRQASIQGIPLEYIQSILKIDENSPSGLTWLPRENSRCSSRFANKIAGCKHTDPKDSYKKWNLNIRYNEKRLNFICSRVIFLLHHGFLTKGKCIDHIDGNPLNNKVENLRESTRNQNNQNSRRPKTNTSGHKNVCWDKKSGKWRVRIQANGKRHYFGLYEDKEEAIRVAIEARKKLHGEFGRDK